MFAELSTELILYSTGAFLLGWIVSLIAVRIRARRKADERDPRDSRIRQLEAEVRIAQVESQKSRSELERLEEELKQTTTGLERRDNVITDQQAKLEKIAADLRDSVHKTRELRAELTERAAENVHAEAKIREVETELSIARASTDLLATGAFEYSDTNEEDEASTNEDTLTDTGQNAR